MTNPAHISRRRLLQVFAAAPFLPWDEILAEAANPRIFYSIPAAPTIRSTLDLLNAVTQQYIDQYLGTTIFGDPIPPETRIVQVTPAKLAWWDEADFNMTHAERKLRYPNNPHQHTTAGH